MAVLISTKIESFTPELLNVLKVGDSINIESFDQYTGGKYLDIPKKIDELLDVGLSDCWHQFKNIAQIGTNDKIFEMYNNNTKYFELKRVR